MEAPIVTDIIIDSILYFYNFGTISRVPDSLAHLGCRANLVP